MSGQLFFFIQAYALAIFLALWWIIGRSDWLYQKITHRHLFFGAAAVSLGYLILLFNTLLGVWGKAAVFYLWGFYSAAAFHFLLCSLTAVSLWAFKVWPAGDAKLFIFL